MTGSWPNVAAKICFFTALLVGIYFRVSHLSDRPLHHDESIHATFAHNWYKNPQSNFYKYDPTYHGPFIYVVNVALYEVFGASVTSARMVPLIFGLAIIFLPFLFYPWMSLGAMMLASGLIAISPSLVYYSQYLAHDMPVLFFKTLGVAALMHAYERWRAGDKRKMYAWGMTCAAATGCLFSVKLISHIWLFLVVSYAVIFWVANKFYLKLPTSNQSIATKKNALFAAAFIGVMTFSYALFQTSLFYHLNGFLDGLYRTALPHWWEQHAIERVKGPVYYHLRGLLLLDLPQVIILTAFTVMLLRQKAWGIVATTALAVLGLLTVPHLWSLNQVFPDFLTNILAHVKILKSADLFLYVMSFVFGILTTVILWQKKLWFLAFLTFWTFGSFAIFSYAGEKGPWLTVHIAYPAALLCGAACAYMYQQTGSLSQYKKIALALAAALTMAYQFHLSYTVMRTTAGEARDLLSQVHNSRDVTETMKWIEKVGAEKNLTPATIPLAVVGKPVWAFYFYLISGSYMNFKITTNDLNGSQLFVILGNDEHKSHGPKLVEQGYQLKNLSNEGWWVPEYTTMGWVDWMKYALLRKPPDGTTGGTPMYVYYKL
jgi:uncharacterized protein (TIGR03663 family)